MHATVGCAIFPHRSNGDFHARGAALSAVLKKTSFKKKSAESKKVMHSVTTGSLVHSSNRPCREVHADTT